jgi:hypothetical protein
MRLGRLPDSPPEVRLAAILFLLLLGLADLFGAWQVADFASFRPGGVAEMVAPPMQHQPPAGASTVASESPVDLAHLDATGHHVHRELLVQDTHVHVPVYAMTAAFLSLIVFGLRMSSRARQGLILLAFAAPCLDFAGLWGAHLLPAAGTVFGALAVAGGFSMGLAYLVVLVTTLYQCRPRSAAAHQE